MAKKKKVKRPSAIKPSIGRFVRDVVKKNERLFTRLANE